MKFKLSVNGAVRSVNVAPETPLVWVLRDELGLTGTKFGCGVSSCGNCTVHVNGAAIKSCQARIDQVADSNVITIEGAQGKVAEAVRTAWVEKNVVQCGYCQSGQIMNATALLLENPSPSDEEINQGMSGNACRCMCYVRIKEAVKSASKALEA
ncbi:MAG: isoquinoline 1-oxidoreductase [Betaproteobacteria bacterium TMED82]|jgi:isoquinoline 1-oxidoreductase alpha subunit|nr:MAG: isoquinoline 1-oxidoreductase [Betaproteobacteria bacterium TMED82]|tara:strand:- start:51 stop:512 length:462 start_codon:yes stop_codon:yes gene_type:complete